MTVFGNRPVIVFDIETVPDPDLLRSLGAEASASDAEVIAQAQAHAREQSNSDFLPIAQHKVAVISVLLRRADQVKIDSRGYPDYDEAQAVRAFFGLIDRFTPTLVSWNGSGFDLPVLHMRAMLHGIAAPKYWRGPGNRYEQYRSRFTDQHQDLMDILAGYQARCYTKLETAALLCGLPGKMGFGGEQVYDMWRTGKHEQIAAYCETDVLNTYLLWVRYRLIAGEISSIEHDEECAFIAAHLRSTQREHLLDFEKSWQRSDSSSTSPNPQT